MKLILPKNHVDVGPNSVWTRIPLFFLAGPVQGGGDWQREAARLINMREHNSLVVIPCRYDENDSIRELHAPNYTQGLYERQTDWERYYLSYASRKGCIIFWLGCESKTNPRNDGQPYARDTYGELGEWRGRLMGDRSINMVMGAEHDFPGLSVIKRNFQKALGNDYPVYSSMEDTVIAAVRMSYR